ncbi:MAG: 3-methylornithyl-N6-L-lysine dehydrogenase PylD [Bacillota bacterium]
MTGLTKHDLVGLDQAIERYDIERYDHEIKRKTGASLSQIACFAAGISEEKLVRAADTNKVFIIPVTAGKGIIPGFARSVRSIVEYLGFQAHVTGEQGVSGFAEAVSGGVNIVFMADDARFVAINFSTGNVIDNAEATARGYVSALYVLCKGLRDRDVMVIGAGRVGSGAILHLQELGARVTVFELNSKKLRWWKQSGIKIEKNLFRALPEFEYIIDACPEPDFIDLEHLHPHAAIAAPGVPLGLTAKAYESFRDRVIHDPLQLGVAAMLAMAARERRC